MTVHRFIGIELLDETGEDQLEEEKSLQLTEGVTLAYTMPAPVNVSCIFLLLFVFDNFKVFSYLCVLDPRFPAALSECLCDFMCVKKFCAESNWLETLTFRSVSCDFSFYLHRLFSPNKGLDKEMSIFLTLHWWDMGHTTFTQGLFVTK